MAYFERIGDYEAAIFIAQRLGDVSALLRLLIG